MPNAKDRYFLCTGEVVPKVNLPEYPGSHIIGHLRYVTDEGFTVPALEHWHVSILATHGLPLVVPDIDERIIGDALNIQCRYPGCERKVNWRTGKAVLRALMSKHGKRWQP